MAQAAVELKLMFRDGERITLLMTPEDAEVFKAHAELAQFPAVPCLAGEHYFLKYKDFHYAYLDGRGL